MAVPIISLNGQDKVSITGNGRLELNLCADTVSATANLDEFIQAVDMRKMARNRHRAALELVQQAVELAKLGVLDIDEELALAAKEITEFLHQSNR